MSMLPHDKTDVNNQYKINALYITTNHKYTMHEEGLPAVLHNLLLYKCVVIQSWRMT